MYVCLGFRYYGKGKTPEEAYENYKKFWNDVSVAMPRLGVPLLPEKCIFVKGEEGTVKEETVTQLVFKESIKQ